MLQASSHTVNYSVTDLNINAYIGPLDTSQYLYVYTVLIICCVFFITARAFMFFKVCMTASRNLHNDMFHSMLRGVMRFFDANSSGTYIRKIFHRTRTKITIGSSVCHVLFTVVQAYVFKPILD